MNLSAHLRDVHQPVLMDADVHKHAEVDDVAHRAGEHHAGLQVLHVQHIGAQDGRAAARPGGPGRASSAPSPRPAVWARPRRICLGYLCLAHGLHLSASDPSTAPRRTSSPGRSRTGPAASPPPHSSPGGRRCCPARFCSPAPAKSPRTAQRPWAPASAPSKAASGPVKAPLSSRYATMFLAVVPFSPDT